MCVWGGGGVSGAGLNAVGMLVMAKETCNLLTAETAGQVQTKRGQCSTRVGGGRELDDAV